MRSFLLTFCGLLVILDIANTVKAEPQALRLRQVSSSPTPSNLPTDSAAPTSASSSPTPTGSDTPGPSQSGGTESSKSPDSSSNSTADASSSVTKTISSISATSTGAVPATTDVNGPLPTSANATGVESNRDALPLQPQITPALSIAGVILIIAGAVYTLIGIKNKWLHIFLSTAFLTSLAVTVLIVYVMNPPIRNAMQGAYFVAALFTGLIFGAGSLVFQEVTEGLGCLFGGFCLSMWFLVLQPGGLLKATSSKAIFIAVFSVATYALSFSHYTRPYGLIGSTSFGGATVVILGIDCFSRAGLKEFWLYIWALNDNLFPLGTNTYPISRGIRVEIASIIIIFLVGIISQLKLWKVIKDRREKKAVIRLDDERRRDKMEEDIGRKLEEGNHKDRAQWEAVYGDQDQSKRQTDSGLGTEEPDSLRKGSISFVETRELGQSAENIEMKALNTPKEGPMNEESARAIGSAQNKQATVQIAEPDDEIQAIDQNGAPISLLPPNRVSGASMVSSNFNASKRESKDGPIAEEQRDNEKSKSNCVRIDVPPPPPVTPLPFTIPTGAESIKDSDGSSIATVAESEPGTDSAKDLKKLSERSIIKRLSGRSSKVVSQSEEALIIPHKDYSRPSSVAATLDDDLDDISSRGYGFRGGTSQAEYVHQEFVTPLQSPEELVSLKVTPSIPASSEQAVRQDGTEALSAQAAPRIAASDFGDFDISSFPQPSGSSSPTKAQPISLTPSINNTPRISEDGQARSPEKPRSNKAPTEATPSVQGRSERRRSRALSEASGRGSLTAGAVEQVPSHVSRVVMSYRTNEWAKHLATVEKPDVDPLQASEIGDEEEEPQVGESVAPVAIEELQQTATSAKPPPAPLEKHTSVISSAEPNGISRSASNMSKVSLQEQQQARSSTQPNGVQTLPSRSSSQASQAKGASTTNLLRMSGSSHPPMLAPRGFRSSSTPMLSRTLAASPIQEGEEAVYPTRNNVSPIPGPTLMAQRDNMVRNKYSSVPLNPSPSPAEPMFQTVPIDPRSASRLSMVDEDNMSLKQRKEIIQQQQQYTHPASQQATTRLSPHLDSFDSHQPQRQFSSAVDPQKREAMLAVWRESMKQDLASTQVPEVNVEARRADMLMEKHQSLLGKEQQKVMAKYRESAFDQAMRKGDMQELHKEAIRRMQANANKHV